MVLEVVQVIVVADVTDGQVKVTSAPDVSRVKAAPEADVISSLKVSKTLSPSVTIDAYSKVGAVVSSPVGD